MSRHRLQHLCGTLRCLVPEQHEQTHSRWMDGITVVVVTAVAVATAVAAAEAVVAAAAAAAVAAAAAAVVLAVPLAGHRTPL